MPHGGVIKDTCWDNCTAMRRSFRVQLWTTPHEYHLHNRSSAPASVPHDARYTPSPHYRPMINIATPQVSPRRSDRIHPDRHRPPPRPDSTRRLLRSDPTETHASHERTVTAGSHDSGLSVREISCVSRH
eukprot:181642-Prymnesium_polylepis.1